MSPDNPLRNANWCNQNVRLSITEMFDPKGFPNQAWCYDMIREMISSLDDQSPEKIHIQISVFADQKMRIYTALLRTNCVSLLLTNHGLVYQINSGGLNPGLLIKRINDRTYHVFIPNVSVDIPRVELGLRLFLTSEFGYHIETIHRRLRIHAAGFANEDFAIVALGRPGSGKSTLAAMVNYQGDFKILGDECIWSDGEWVYPFVTRIYYRGKEAHAKSVVDALPHKISKPKKIKYLILLDEKVLLMKIRVGFSLFRGEGLPQMLIFQLSMRRLLQIFTWIPHRLKLSYKITQKLNTTIIKQQGDPQKSLNLIENTLS